MLTTEEILDSAEDVIRRFGPKKATVVDVARELNVSHGTVYRHFESKSALHIAITKRWLERATSPLKEIVKNSVDQRIKLREWFKALMNIKVQKALDDPEMFASYLLLTQKLPEHIVFEHLEILIKQIEEILVDGKKSDVFDIEDCALTAHTLFFATIRYHHPLHASEWSNETIEGDFNHLFTLLEKAIHK